MSEQHRPKTASERSADNIKITVLIIVGLAIMAAILLPNEKEPSINFYDPESRSTINREIEAADMRSGYSLSKEEVKAIAEEVTIKEYRK